MSGPTRTEFDARVAITNQGIVIKPVDATMLEILYPDDPTKGHSHRPGDAGFNSKVNETDARDIVKAGLDARARGGSMAELDEELAEHYDVSPATIRAIRLGKRWKWVYHSVVSNYEPEGITPEADELI